VLQTVGRCVVLEIGGRGGIELMLTNTVRIPMTCSTFAPLASSQPSVRCSS
jgi:hypothetical protein